jgi:putative hemolysin
LDPEPTILSILLSAAFLSKALSIVVLFLLLIFSALISGAEVAFFSLSQTDINRASESKSSKEKAVVALLERPKKLLATILVSNNFINILIVLLFAYIGDFLFAEIASSLLKFIIEVVLVIFLILLFGEVLPKLFVSRNSLKFAALMAYPLKVLLSLLSFISFPLLRLSNIIENNLGKQKSSLSVEKLSQALGLTSNESADKDDQKILRGIVSFGNTETGQIMTPRIDIFALSKDETYENVVAKIVNEGFSRNPVYDENIDEIIGVLYAKDLLPYIDVENFEWQKLVREPYFVPENKKLDDLLKEFQEKKNHLAVVVDEYGGTSGIVTLEDVIEEIVGDISDEYDQDDAPYSIIDENSFLFDGKINLKDFYKIIEIEDNYLFEENKGESETLAGFILEIHGRFPRKQEIITFYEFSFKVELMDKKRIKQVKVTIDRALVKE